MLVLTVFESVEAKHKEKSNGVITSVSGRNKIAWLKELN